MVIVGLDYGFAGQMGVDEVRGGAPYGATTIAGTDGNRTPGAEELAGARYQGRRVAEVAMKLAGPHAPDDLDEALENSFPASDPPAISEPSGHR